MTSAILENNVWSRKRSLYRRFSLPGRVWSGCRRSLEAWRFRMAVSQPMAFKRVIDLCVATLAVVTTAPIWGPVFALVIATGGGIERKKRVGRYLRPFDMLRLYSSKPRIHRFLEWTRIQYLPVFWNILVGDMSFVGPRPTSIDELDLRSGLARRRHSDRPGMLCLWWLRSRANIDFGTEAETDSEYIESFSVRGDLGIAARALLAFFYGGKPQQFAARPEILDIPIDNKSMDEAIEQIVAALDGPPQQVCFVNADCANLAARNPGYHTVLRQSEINYADGIGMKLAGRFLRSGIQQNVNGTDLFPRLIKQLRGTGHSVYLLGGRPGVADGVREWIEKYHPETDVAGTHHGYFSTEEEDNVIRGIRESGANLLLVAFGAPRQDVWIREHLTRLGVNVGIGVGGLFDFYSGRVQRAPQWVREIGMEWLFRFSQEPGRLWKRYFLGNGVFLARVFFKRVRGARRKTQPAFRTTKPSVNAGNK